MRAILSARSRWRSPVPPAALPRIAVVPQLRRGDGRAPGIDSVYAGEWEYMVGGGVATFDCNGDGFADMLLAGGASPASSTATPAREAARCASSRSRAGSNWTR